MPENLVQILEGAILAADQPLSIDRMMALFDDAPPRAEIRAALDEISAACEGRGFELKEVASGFRFQVRARYGDWISRLWDEKPPRYSRALLETLALIAYKQPITRGDIEEIRGVSTSTNIIRSLLEREWIRVVGHRDVPGRPALYASTRTFLDYFNLASLEELPTLAEIRDLDKVNAELDLDTTEPPEPRTLELEAQEGTDVDDDMADSADLDAVTDQVNQIQENIRNLFAGDTDDAEDQDLGDSGEADQVTGVSAPDGSDGVAIADEGAAPDEGAPPDADQSDSGQANARTPSDTERRDDVDAGPPAPAVEDDETNPPGV